MDHFASVFDTAGDDVEAEARERIHTMATQQATSTCWPFLALAKSEPEFEHRLALMEDRLTSIASEHGVSYEEITGPLREGFKAVLGAGLDPKAASGLKCADCGHANPQHEEGGPCPCGCVAFNPRGKRSSLTTQAKPWEWKTDMGDPLGRGQFHLADWSPECSEGGNGQCDGFKENGGECGCPCHTTTGNLPQTVDGMKDWHDDLHGNYPDHHEGSRKTAADEDEGQRFQCPDCYGTPMTFDMMGGGGLQTCQGACKGSGVVYRKRRADSDGGYSLKDFDFTPAPKTAAKTADRTGPTIDSAEGYEYEPAPEHVQRAMQRRFEGGGATAIHPDKPGYYLHGVGNWWDGPSEVKDNGDGSYTYKNPYNGDEDRFDEHGYYRPDGSYRSRADDIREEYGTPHQSSFDGRLAGIKQALSEGVNPLEWLEGDSPGPVPTHHETTQVFEGTNPVALDQALAEGGGTGQAENEVGHQSVQAAREPDPFA